MVLLFITLGGFVLERNVFDNNFTLMNNYNHVLDHIMQDYQQSGDVRDPGSLSFSCRP